MIEFIAVDLSFGKLGGSSKLNTRPHLERKEGEEYVHIQGGNGSSGLEGQGCLFYLFVLICISIIFRDWGVVVLRRVWTSISDARNHHERHSPCNQIFCSVNCLASGAVYRVI